MCKSEGVVLWESPEPKTRLRVEGSDWEEVCLHRGRDQGVFWDLSRTLTWYARLNLTSWGTWCCCNLVWGSWKDKKKKKRGRVKEGTICIREQGSKDASEAQEPSSCPWTGLFSWFWLIKLVDAWLWGRIRGKLQGWGGGLLTWFGTEPNSYQNVERQWFQVFKAWI